MKSFVDIDFKVSDTETQRIRGVKKQYETPAVWVGDNSRLAQYLRSVPRPRWDVYEFFGIPYAWPLGKPGTVPDSDPAELYGRWRAPVVRGRLPVSSGQVFDATGAKYIANNRTGPQRSDLGGPGWRPTDGPITRSFDWSTLGVIESEDCCYLNIYTPRPHPGAKMPVVVYVHDGGNTENHRMLPRSTGTHLSRMGVVFVSVEWPLSNRGFFSHPSLGPAFQINIAYQAALAALEWVQEHITDFGGDPKSVCFEGASAGGAMVTLLMPQATNRFHRVLAHSGAGAGQRIVRASVDRLGEELWERLNKTRKAYYDPSRTIGEIAASDGVAEALRLGPSPDQLQGFLDRRTVWEYDWSTQEWTSRTATPTNYWPAQDGVLIEEPTAIEEVVNRGWPVGVQYTACTASNESGLIDGARSSSEAAARGWLTTLGFLTTEAQDDFITNFLTVPGDDWKRLAYNLLYTYPANRLAREHMKAHANNNAYVISFAYDTLGSGRTEPSHVHQQSWFYDKAAWQAAGGSRADSVRIYAADLLLGDHLARRYANYAKSGDWNGDYKSPFDVSPFRTRDYEDFGDFATIWAPGTTTPGDELGNERTVIIQKKPGNRNSAPSILVAHGHNGEVFQKIDTAFDDAKGL